MTQSPLDFIHRFVPAPESPAPFTLLLLHGTGGDEEDLLPVGRELAPQAALLSPRGKVLENGMPRFFRRLAEGVFDLKDVQYRASELAAFVTAAASRYSLDPNRIYAVGYSNGANIAAAMLLLHPGTLAGAVLFRAMVPLVPNVMPSLQHEPVFLSAGRRDPIVPPAHPERLAEMLTAAGAEVTLHWTDGGHALQAGEIAVARDWLQSSLQPARS